MPDPSADACYEEADQSFGTGEVGATAEVCPYACKVMGFLPKEEVGHNYEIMIVTESQNEPGEKGGDVRFWLSIDRITCKVFVAVRIYVTNPLYGAVWNAVKKAVRAAGLGNIGQMPRARMREVEERWKRSIEEMWSGRAIVFCHDPKCEEACPSGYEVIIEARFVDDIPAQIVKVQQETTDQGNWGEHDTDAIRHEFGHMLNNPDEYNIIITYKTIKTPSGLVWIPIAKDWEASGADHAAMHKGEDIDEDDLRVRYFDVIRQRVAARLGCDESHVILKSWPDRQARKMEEFMRVMSESGSVPP